MKKKLALLLVGTMLVMSLAACGNENETNTNETEAGVSGATTEQSGEVEQSSEAEPVETITLADIVVEDYVTVENYKGIMEYTDQSIILQTKTGRICIQANAAAVEA